MSLFLTNKEFKENGFMVIKNVIPLFIIQQLREDISKNIKKCSEQLKVSEEDYLSSVSRWVSPSLVTSSLTSSLLDDLSEATQEIVGASPILSKFNIICKNAYCKEAIPFHQDISYSPQAPYQLSAWLALHDTPKESGPLEVISKSHLGAISPAVDFWSPEFVPDPILKKQAKQIPIDAGDVIFFDSRLWHGSGKNKNLSPRYALVTRWVTKKWKPNQVIPSIEPKFFGIWTSGKMSQKILAQGLQYIYNKKENSYLELVEAWEKVLEDNILPFSVDEVEVMRALKKIKILHLAFMQHNGGHATGTLYKNLWSIFLSPMTKYLQQIQKKSKNKVLVQND